MRSCARQPRILPGRRSSEPQVRLRACRGVPGKRLCELLEISRSGYYEWSSRPLSTRYLDDVELAAEIYEIHDTSRRTPMGHPELPLSCMTEDVITARSPDSVRVSGRDGRGTHPNGPRRGRSGARSCSLARRSVRASAPGCSEVGEGVLGWWFRSGGSPSGLPLGLPGLVEHVGVVGDVGQGGVDAWPSGAVAFLAFAGGSVGVPVGEQVEVGGDGCEGDGEGVLGVLEERLSGSPRCIR